MKPDPSRNSAVLFRIAIILTSALFGLLITQSLSSYFPKQFRSTVTLQVKTDAPPRPFEAESNLIQRKEILYPVIDTLDLLKAARFSKTPSREQIYFKLREELAITPVRNTELIQISITDPDPQFAAVLANAIAEEYRRRRNTEQIDQVSIDLKAMEEEVARQRDKAETLRAKADAIRDKEGESSEAYQKAHAESETARLITEKVTQRLQTVRVPIHLPVNPVTIWEKAEPSAISTSTPPIFRLAIGALLGAVLGCILSLFVRKNSSTR